MEALDNMELFFPNQKLSFLDRVRKDGEMEIHKIYETHKLQDIGSNAVFMGIHP